MKKIVLITKDAVSKNYLPVYKNKYWKTPNMEELANKGTVYNRHYTVAASTAMAFYSMITGENCFQTSCKDYGDEQPFNGETIFDKFEKLGYKTYLIWDKTYTSFAKQHLKIVDGKTEVISLDIIPNIPPHQKGIFDDLTFKDKDTNLAMKRIKDMFLELGEKDENSFVWIHLPHVLAGRNSYCSDIDLFDDVVGYAREIFGDESIFISADHGNMDGKNGKFGYGFDLEETAICIPLISPRVENLSEIDFLTSNLDLFDILLRKPNKQEYVVSDTAYYCQPKRKIAIIHSHFKLIYDKSKKRFCLFDLNWDPDEKYNLFYPEFYDVDRMSWYSLNQRFFYPFWSEAIKEKELLLKRFDEIWRVGSTCIELKNKIKFRLKYLYKSMKKSKINKSFKNVGK